MTRMTSLRAALLVASGLLAACSSDTDSTESSAGIMTLEFEIEAAQIDDHPFPSDVYLDRAFLTQPMGAPFQTPILATPTFRGLLGLNESQCVGGFSVSQAGALNLDLANPANTGVVAGGFAFLNQLSTNFRNGYSTTTPVVIPFSSLPGEVVDAGSLEGNVLIFDIGIPVFGMTADVAALRKTADEAYRRSHAMALPRCTQQRQRVPRLLRVLCPHLRLLVGWNLQQAR